MPWEEETWVDDDGSLTVGTPFNAERMNNIEDGIGEALDLMGLIGWTPLMANGITELDPGVFEKTSGVGEGGKLVSAEGYTRGCYLTFQPATTNKGFGIGLNSDPLTDEAFGSIDYWINCNSAGTIILREAGVEVAAPGSYKVGDVLAITYDGKTIRYWQNGVQLREVARAIGSPLFVDSWWNQVGGKVTNMHFGPMGESGGAFGWPYKFLTNVEETDPGAGGIKFNHATFGLATKLYVSTTSALGEVLTGEVPLWGTGTSVTRAKVILRSKDEPKKFYMVWITSEATSKESGKWDVYSITPITNNFALTNGENIVVEVIRVGDKGEKGSTGEKGEKGEAGPRVLTEATEPIEFKEGANLREEIRTEVPEANNHLMKLRAIAEKTAELLIRGSTAATKTIAAAIANGYERTVVDGEGRSSFLQWSKRGEKAPSNVNGRQVIKGSVVIEKEALETAEVAYPSSVGEPSTDVVIVFNANLANTAPYAQTKFEAAVGVSGVKFKRAEKGSAGRLYYILVLGA